MTVGSVLQIEKEALICVFGTRNLAGVTLNSCKLVFYVFVFQLVPLIFKKQTILKTTTFLEKQRFEEWRIVTRSRRAIYCNSLCDG
jgi:hypothetical protein